MSIQNETNSESVSIITSIARIRSDIFSSNQSHCETRTSGIPTGKTIAKRHLIVTCLFHNVNVCN